MNRIKVELSEAKGRAKNQVSKLKSLFLSLLLIIGLSFSVSAQKAEAKKELSESYKVTKDFTLGIDNKYGAIDVVSWDKNELEVVVEMIVKASSEEKAQKVLDNIDIDVDEGGNGVKFVTQIDLKNHLKNINFEVNYKVSAPAHINVDLIQKYGSIYLEEITGDASIVLKYSSIKAQSLMNASGKANSLTMAYSEGTIKSTGKLSAKLAYSEIKFASVESYEGKLAYSSFTAENLSGKLITEAAYSDVMINNLEAGFELVDISMAYGDVEILAAENASFSYEMDNKHGDVNAPKGAEKVGEKDHGHGPDFNQAVIGKVGSGAGGKVEIHAKYSDLTLK